MQKINGLRSKIDQFNSVQTLLEDAETLYEMFREMGDDEDLLKETAEAADKATEALEKMELETLLNGKYDRNNAIISIHPGAGGTESQDWADMLYRMYVHWAEKNGYSVNLLDYLAGEEAGIKSVTLLIKGENAFGYLKAEKGVHRIRNRVFSVRFSHACYREARHRDFSGKWYCFLCDIFQYYPECDLRTVHYFQGTFRTERSGNQVIFLLQALLEDHGYPSRPFLAPYILSLYGILESYL